MAGDDRKTRRRFLTDSIAAAAAMGSVRAAASGEQNAPATRPAWAIACRDPHLRCADRPDAWSAMDALGVDGVEVVVDPDLKCPYLFGPGDTNYSIATPEGIRVLGERFRSAGKRITAFCLNNDFDGKPDENVEWTVRVAQAAAALGVPAIRLDVVPHRMGDKTDEFLKLAIRLNRKIIDATRDTTVRFGVENHGGYTNRPDVLRRMFEGVGSKRFGQTLDTANFYWFGHPLSKLYRIYDEFGPYICHTHCKNIRFPEPEREKQREIGWKYNEYCCPIYEGDIDFAQVIAILRRHDYTGDLCIENESLDRFPRDRRAAILRKEADLLRKLAASA